MDLQKIEYTLHQFSAQAAQTLAIYIDHYGVGLITFIMCCCLFIGISPLTSCPTTTSFEMVLIIARKILVLMCMALISTAVFLWLFLYTGLYQDQPMQAFSITVNLYKDILQDQWLIPVIFGTSAVILRFILNRWGAPLCSSLLRRFRFLQPTQSPNDIQQEVNQYQRKDFDPAKYYQQDKIFIGLDQDNSPDYVSLDTWHETNMQVIGPTRYGKGVLLGCLMDQSIRLGDALVYIDPKADTWAPHILLQAAKATSRPFYYLALHDDGPGSWAPFTGGSIRDAAARLEIAFGLQYTGNAGTDYYKSQEKAELEAILLRDRSIKGMFNALKDNDKTNRINAELAQWSEIQALCPVDNTSFSIERALEENAIVYVQGSLDDAIVTTATKVFITEYVQTARTLFKQKKRTTHATMVVDEVSFLASQTLAKSLATCIGFNMNFVLTYQSPSDLLNIDDKTIDPKYLLQSITVNSQLKVTYGGSDKDSAELVSKLSGTTMKSFTRLETTDVNSATGGEVWKNGRSIMQQEVPLIHSNTMYVLPPRVCAFFQPHSLAQIRYTSHVPVSDTQILDEYLEALSTKPRAEQLKTKQQARRSKQKQAKKAEQAEH